MDHPASHLVTHLDLLPARLHHARPVVAGPSSAHPLVVGRARVETGLSRPGVITGGAGVAGGERGALAGVLTTSSQSRASKASSS